MALFKKKAKKATKKPKSTARPSKPAMVAVPNHRFEPGTKVSFLPLAAVTVERGLGREPFATPTKTATVKANGALEVSGLPKGMWCAAGPVGGRWVYIQFSVK